jgi:hypothetical protein
VSLLVRLGCKAFYLQIKGLSLYELLSQQRYEKVPWRHRVKYKISPENKEKMGSSNSVAEHYTGPNLTEDMMDDYLQLTYLSRKEIYR